MFWTGLGWAFAIELWFAAVLVSTTDTSQAARRRVSIYQEA